jgi:hypothetical protein
MQSLPKTSWAPTTGIFESGVQWTASVSTLKQFVLSICISPMSGVSIDTGDRLADPCPTLPRSDDTTRVAARTLVVPKDHLYGIAFEQSTRFFGIGPRKTNKSLFAFCLFTFFIFVPEPHSFVIQSQFVSLFGNVCTFTLYRMRSSNFNRTHAHGR